MRMEHFRTIRSGKSYLYYDKVSLQVKDLILDRR